METWMMPVMVTALLVVASQVLALLALRAARRGRSEASDLVAISLGAGAAVDSVGTASEVHGGSGVAPP